jgi:ATP-dependent DNA helicase RecQ
MRRQQLIQLALPSKASAAGKRSSAPHAVVVGLPSVSPEVLTAPVDPAALRSDDSYDAVLFERLRAERTVLARQDAVPPYCVVNDRTLREMAIHLPTDHEAFLQIHGIGQAKADKYGATFVALIRQHCEGLSKGAGQKL